MKYAVEMASGGMIYIPSFMTVSSAIQVILRLILYFSILMHWLMINLQGHSRKCNLLCS
jgi:hypothetical protein